MKRNIKIAKEVLRVEAEAVRSLSRRIGGNFDKAVEAIFKCKGRVVVTGMGKPGIIGQKISATLASTGTPSLSLHPAEAVHGDLGRVRKSDVIIALSNSGETQEIAKLLPVIKKIGSCLIAITGKPISSLAKHSDIVLDVGVKKEACPMNLAPTASTTAMLAMGDALAVALIKRRGFKESDFALYHPGGALGKKLLLKVEDIMRKGKSNPVVKEDTPVRRVLLAITSARAGSANVVNKRGKLTGIFTDGDLRRHLGKDPQLVKRKVKEVMTPSPKTIHKGHLAAEAFRILKEYKIDEVPIVDDAGHPVGLLDVQDILKAGLV